MTAMEFSTPGLPIRQLLLVTPDLLWQVWPQVQDLFIENISLWRDYYSIEDFPQLFYAGKLQLWVMNDADDFILVMITSLQEFPQMKTLTLNWVFGSEFQSALPFLDYVEKWAQEQGVKKSFVFGREGFLRLLRPHGYVKKAVALEKDIFGMVEH